MRFRQALSAGFVAQFASFSQSSRGISVNIPEDTAAGNSQTIYLQIHGPADSSWVGFGQGTRMAGANMFIVYADGNGNVTVSPRLGTGQVEPEYNSAAEITVLEGSGIDSGSMIANIRCDSCLSWSSGSMSATDSSSSWIWAYNSGSALDTTDTSATIRQHNTEGSFSLDLTQGIGGTSANPFISAAADTTEASGTASATTTAAIVGETSGSNAAVGGSTSSGDTLGLRKAHGIIMSITFVVLLPLAALTLYLPFAKRVLFVHAPLQVIGVILMIVGLALGVVLGNRVNELDGYHMVIGYIVVASLILFQPALGFLQHMYFRRHGGRSLKGVIHQWLGRVLIILGIINGGLGFMITGPVGSTFVPRGAVIAYGVIAGIVALVYLAVVILAGRGKSGSGSSSPSGIEKKHERGWETELQPRQSSADPAWEPQGQAHGSATNAYRAENRI